MCSAFIFIERIGSRSMEAKKRKCGDDAVSNLRDELLCHILSFLPTKEAALTSVLSKRWRDLFALVPSLDLDDSIFVAGDRPIVCERTSFIEFVDRALALYSHSPMTKFSVTFERGVDKYLVEHWIFQALLRHRVSDLTLMWHSPPSGFSLPSTILNFGQSLVQLKLGSGKVRLFDVLTHGHLIFRKLKTLHLDTIHFDAARKEFALLLSKCPVLEELIVNGLNSYCLSLAPVSASTLKRLTIDCEHDLTDLDRQIYAENHIFYFGTEAPNNVSFDTPNLLYLNYSDFVACNYPLVKLDSLVEARLDLGLTWGHMCARDSDDEFKVRGDATNLIMGIHKVQTLYLSSDTLEVISYFCETIPVFHNLNHLSIESDDERGWQSLPQLLINCPNLQTLVFHGLHHMITDGCGDACDCISHHSSSSSCLSSCPVRILKILEFGATCAEMSLVEHFLKNMPQLEQVIVVLLLESSQEGDFDLYEVSKALEMAPRASPNCMLKIVNRGIVLLPKKNVV